jgi:O-acetylserine/cysteine efflux transporter
VFCFVASLYSLLFPGRFSTPFWPGLLMASCAGSLQMIPLFMGLAQIDASFAVLILQAQVPMAVIAAALINRETISAGRFAGIVVAFLGVAAIAGLPEHPPSPVAIGLILLGAGVWAVGLALIRRVCRDEPTKLYRLVALHSAPQLLLGSALLETGQWASVTSATPQEWASFALLAVAGSAFGNLLWYTLLRRVRVDQATPFLLLMPVVGVVASALVLGEKLTMAHLIGGALILAGLAIVVSVRQSPSGNRLGVTHLVRRPN